MEFATLFITPVVESLLVPIKKHLGFLVSSTNYVREMGTKMKKLDAKLDDIKDREKTNNINSRMVPHQVENWKAQVETIKTEAERIESAGNGCFNMKMRYRVGKQSSNILKKIDDLIKDESEITWTNELITLSKVMSSKKPSTFAPVHDGISFESRDKIFKDALKFLEPSNTKTQKIALCGMGGVGKTTMMEQLKKAVEDSKMFDWVVKVVIGKNADPVSIQRAISEKIGDAVTETTKDGRAERLKKRFTGMSEDGKKKILVILDDLWDEIDLKDIGLTSPFPNGFKLLLTSRIEEVCTSMGVDKSSILRMEVLKEQEAKRFFWEISGNVDHDLQKIGDDIVKECGGLPIALKIIASTLRDNIKDAWEVALLRLQNHDSRVLKVVNEICEISYNNLKEDDDRAIFHLCGLFPDDFDIPIEDLLRYGWGLKLFKIVNTIPSARHLTNTCVNNLIRSNLLIQSDRVGFVKMHDLVRDFVLSNFSKFKQASIVNYDNKSEWPTQDTKESCERIWLKCTGMPEFPANFLYPNLKFLKLIDAENLPNFPQDFDKRMENLEVVAYESMNIPMLPQMQYSTTLRTLCFRSCNVYIEDISCLGNLINLEILSFADCNIERLPSTIGKLIKLKLLDLTGCDKLCIDDGVFRNLINLEELYMRVSKYSDDTVRFTDTNCDELEKLSMNLLALDVEFFKNRAQPKHVSFKKLERFRISMGCKLKQWFDDDDDDGYSYKNTLKLITNLNELLESKINELFKKTKILYLQVSGMNYLEDILMDSQHSFCNLNVLDVCDCEDLTFLFTSPIAKSLSKLERLKVVRCPVLKSLVHDESENTGVEVIMFPVLKFLILEDLHKLVCVCDNASVIELPQLKRLILSGLPNFTSVFPENSNNNSAMTPFLNKNVIIPKLEILNIYLMENLKQIWPCDKITTSDEVDNISMLREIEVHKCDSIVNLFPSNPMQLITHLQYLEVAACNSIEELFSIESNKVTNGSLRGIGVYSMEKLKQVWRIKGENNSRPLIGGFHAVEFIHIEECKSFRSIWTPATLDFRLEALISISIKNDLVTNSQQVNDVSKEEISEFDDNISTIAFTSHAENNFNQLRYISLRKYEGVEVVFDIQSPSSSNTQQQPLLLPNLEDLELVDMQIMSHVWKCNWNEFFRLQKQHPQSSFQNLTTINMFNCNRIKYLFSPLMARLLSKLKKVEIDKCDGIEEVVSNRDDEADKDEEMFTSISTQRSTTLFPNLDFLSLENLRKLERIGGKATATAIYEGIKVSQVDAISWSLSQYSRKISIKNCDALPSVVSSYAIGEIKKLQVLKIYSCQGMMEVFETPRINNSGGGCNTNVDEDNGGTIATQAIPRTKDIITLKLPNLKELEIIKCNALEYVFTFSALESLRHLKELKIKSCKKMKVIVKEEHGDQTMTSKNVVFPRLQFLKLKDLQSLKGFCLGNEAFSWPSLNTLEIKECPEITFFTKGHLTVPEMTKIETSSGSFYGGEDINSIIKTKKEEGFKFLNMEIRWPWESL